MKSKIMRGSLRRAARRRSSMLVAVDGKMGSDPLFQFTR
jgi:hypothetical protein